jgi:RimJ/RimL family protein N-acetyltransferase
MRIREVTPEDAVSVISLLQRLYSETSFLLYDPGESVPRVEDYAKRISDGRAKESVVLLVAENLDGLIGVISGGRGTAKRNRHSLFLVLGVLQAQWHQGVGRSLLGAMENWALAHGIHRLELTVRMDNARALQLYEKVGFIREGTKHHSLKIEGQFVDELFMSKLIAA